MAVKILTGLLVVLFATVESANAFYFGAGIHAGINGCSSDETSELVSDEMVDIQDDLDDAKDQMKALKEQKRDLDKKKRALDASIRKTKYVLKKEVYEGVESHIRFGRPGASVANICDGNVAKSGGDPQPWGSFCRDLSAGKKSDLFPAANEWENWARSTGDIDNSLCTTPTALNRAYYNQPRAQADCKEGIRHISEMVQVEQDLEMINQYIEDQKQVMAYLKKDLKQERREVQRMIRRGETDDLTEASDCEDCNRRGTYKKGPSTWEKVAGIAVGGLLGYGAYKLGKKSIDTNADLGWPTHPMMSAGILMPMAMAGIYGGMAGSNSCNPYGGMNPMMAAAMYGQMGGAFGYPSNMFGGGFGPMMGGGMFMPGMGPWGMGGPWGSMGMNPMMMNPMAMMMNPMGMNGMMNPMMGMNGMMNPMMGMNGMNGMMNPMMGMNGMMNPMMGMNGMMNPMMGGGMDMQMQQQMMMQYQQQMQFVMQQQQAQMQRSQMVGQLQQELYRIQMQIQQISMGGYMGGNGGFGLGTPVDILPLPGSNNTGGNPITIPGRGRQ